MSSNARLTSNLLTLQIQSAALVVLLAGFNLVSAHGHVASWTINGEEKAGFNPSSINQYGPTAERPTINTDQGKPFT